MFILIRIETRAVEGTPVLHLRGDLDGAAGAEVRSLLSGLLDGRQPMVVVDLAGVERLYAAGVFALADWHRDASRLGGRLVCCGARPFVRELLRITWPDRALELKPDLESALDLSRAAS